MSNKGAESNQQAAQRRAESYYLLYAALGRERSLSKLRETLADLGLSVSLNTLKSYSANHDWQGRAEFLDQRNTSLEHANLPAEMNERHARLGIALQTVAGKRLETIDASELSVGDAPRLAKAGVDIERLATGQANERYELVASMLSPMIYDLVDLFKTVNVIDDPQARVTAWARQADAIVLAYIAEDVRRLID
jgi:hypothetical protein